MAGEYYRWLARDVKPEEKRELTREEKLKNWWYYHKWHLLIALVAVLVVGDIAADILTQRRNQPDYSVAYVGSSYLPEDTVVQLTEALALLGEDLNGNGKVQVALHQYIAYPPEDAGQQSASNPYNLLYGGQVQLAADITNGDSYFFLMEDPERFQADYEILTPGDSEEQTMYYAWADCPVLTELPLGEYTVETLEKSYSGMSQDILSGLYIGRRGYWEGETCKYPEGWEAFWNQLIRGNLGGQPE